MRKLFFLLIALFFTFPVLAGEGFSLLPNPKLTPGKVLSVAVEKICQEGYSKSVRRTSRELKNEIYKKYGVKKDIKRYKIDHLIPLSLGGADEGGNLWPSPLFPQPMNGYDKDRLEFRLHRMVCHEGYDIKTAQQEIRQNWLDAYRKHCPTRAACPSYVEYRESIGKPVTRKKGISPLPPHR